MDGINDIFFNVDYKNIIDRALRPDHSQTDQLKRVIPVQALSFDAKFSNFMAAQGINTLEGLESKIDFREDQTNQKLAEFRIDPDIFKLVPPQIVRLNRLLPLEVIQDNLIIAISYPYAQTLIDDLSMATGLHVITLPAHEYQITAALKRIMSTGLWPEINRILNEFTQGDSKPALTDYKAAGINEKEDAPVIRLVNNILLQSVLKGCSDIHIDVVAQQVRVRFRIDGELRDILVFPAKHLPIVVSRVKIMAGLDIAEKRIPQDGRFRLSIMDKEVDFRVATLPTTDGEKVVIRVLDRTNALVGMEQLGLSQSNLELVKVLTGRPYGILLVTGSTGSGKTTTLYNLLNSMDCSTKNIITLEDPVEYSMPGINQVQVNNKAGLSFSEGLGSILRQDPDIIMLGEIRDNSTARMAVQAALTGHLVLSTLHTNTAIGTVARLIDLGIEHFLLATSLAGVISQRLVRRLCNHCRTFFQLDSETAKAFGIPGEIGHPYFRAVGCRLCGYSGYQGRIAIQEVMFIGTQSRSAIYNRASDDDLCLAAESDGMIAIKTDGLIKAKKGWTSLEEVMNAVLME